MTARIKIPKVEFYITNVCNLTCDHCNRFNNYNFKGWQAWSDHAETYARWAEYLDIDQIVVLGGEPLLNPNIIDWIQGLGKLWPCWKQILTNGHRLTKVKGLYDQLEVNKFWLGISLHNENDFEQLAEDIRQFMPGPITEHHGRGNNRFNADYCFIDAKNMLLPLWTQNEFITSAIKTNKDGKFTLHNSKPEDAHSVCPMAQHKSYHFINGKLYKCGPVALFPEFDEQFGLDLTPEDRELMLSYKPLTVDEFETRGAEFFAELDNPIPQCKFCCGHPETEKIWPIRKGSKQ